MMSIRKIVSFEVVMRGGKRHAFASEAMAKSFASLAAVKRQGVVRIEKVEEVVLD